MSVCVVCGVVALTSGGDECADGVVEVSGAGCAVHLHRLHAERRRAMLDSRLCEGSSVDCAQAVQRLGDGMSRTAERGSGVVHR